MIYNNSLISDTIKYTSQKKEKDISSDLLRTDNNHLNLKILFLSGSKTIYCSFYVPEDTIFLKIKKKIPSDTSISWEEIFHIPRYSHHDDPFAKPNLK